MHALLLVFIFIWVMSHHGVNCCSLFLGMNSNDLHFKVRLQGSVITKKDLLSRRIFSVIAERWRQAICSQIFTTKIDSVWVQHKLTVDFIAIFLCHHSSYSGEVPKLNWSTTPFSEKKMTPLPPGNLLSLSEQTDADVFYVSLFLPMTYNIVKKDIVVNKTPWRLSL